MDLDEVRVLVHQMYDRLILLFCGHVECLNRDLRQAKELLEDVFLIVQNVHPRRF